MTKELILETKIAIFRRKEIRKTIHNNEWWFSVADVVEALQTAPTLDNISRKCAGAIRNWTAIGGQFVPPLNCWRRMATFGY